MPGKAKIVRIALVTGATGFIGRFLVNELHANGYAVRVFSRRRYLEDNQYRINEEQWFTGELSDQEALLRAAKDVEVVFHLAGITHDAGRNSKQIYETNLTGTQNIYSACVLNGVRSFIFMSSIVASDPVRSAYAQSKLAAERFLSTYGIKDAVTQVTILRPANVYGAGMRGNISTLIRLIRQRLLPALPEFKASFPLVSVQDLCRVSIAAGQAVAPARKVSIYTVAETEPYTANRIESAVYQCLERNKPNWKLPRSVFYVAIMLVSLMGALRLVRTGISWQLYRKLSLSREIVGSSESPAYEFAPSTTLESEMPKIIEFLRTR